MAVLRQFARLESDKQAISVGFVGYPNVGKSSVINTLRTKNVRVTNLADASEHIGEVLKRVKKEHLQRAHKISNCLHSCLPILFTMTSFFRLQLCKSSGKLLKGGEPDLTTAANMILHDWQRGQIPFFVPPPKQEDEIEAEKDENVNDDDEKAVAARKAIEDVILSQHIEDVPIQTDLFSEAELIGETSEKLPVS
ncbi:hypothetical protein BUALT_Bualt18G0052500 [Buddleja alternifolia]|uniref:G domain-containing protein n=1 Tax=Buddleja alternifolia TaxID=168488 RepID=A0AAV6W3Z9_9LAMI|nr:hypothetical protein BUALT_Bualt18G0052500 [Buddleja alternifolia]